MYTGNTIPDELSNQIPEKYSEFVDRNNETLRSESFYYLPEPSSLYYYQYDWGYFGSPFIYYMSRGDGVNNGIQEYFYNVHEYELLEEGTGYNVIWDTSAGESPEESGYIEL